MTSRLDLSCDQCPGELVYREQVQTPKGIRSLFECSLCDQEVRIK